jgi:large subunit ribosomal protein L22
MLVTSTYKYARISPFKAREVTREIQGLPVSAALDLVAFSPKKAAVLIEKTLKSAVANAENNADLRAENLVVKEATIGEAPTFKRFQPKARGSAGPIRKRTSHIRIVLTDEIEIKTREAKKKSASTASRAGAKKTAGKAKKIKKAAVETAEIEAPKSE